MTDTLEQALRNAATRAGASWDGALAVQLQALCEELLRWNERMRLVGYRDTDSVYENLVYEALELLAALPASGRILDVGSGAGFPGLVLATARSSLEIVSVDAREKKVHFQQHAARQLGLKNFEARALRLDPHLPERSLGRFVAVTAQALAAPGELIPWLAPYLEIGGRLALLQGPAWKKQRETVLKTATAHGLTLVAEREHTLPGSGAARIIVLFGAP